MKKILIGTPIKQKSKILKEFLLSLEELDLSKLEVSYYFIDDNTDKESTKLLKNFKEKHERVVLESSSNIVTENEDYICNEAEHKWKKNLITRVTIFKNKIIEYAKDNQFDYLFFIDSDIVLNPNTIQHLIKRNVDIVSNIFWTQWVQNNRVEPQVWLQDVNNFYTIDWDHPYSKEDIAQLDFDFINKLKNPGIYPVGGLGACTLLNKKAIQSGVNFSLIDNVSFWGEDRHFCIRARVLGLGLYIDTVYPAYHIYRETLLEGVKEFKKNGFHFELISHYSGRFAVLRTKIKKGFKLVKTKLNPSNLKNKVKKSLKKHYARKRIVSNDNKIVLSMIVKNEANNFLQEVLTDAITYVDEVVIIDDASDDNTVEVCEEILKDIPHRIIQNKTSMFATEYKLRMKQWKETLKSKPDWILFLDADDVFEKKMKTSIRHLVANKDVDLYCFRYFDMWDKTHYRSDEYWQGHLHYRPMLVRYQPKFPYRFRKTKQHCGTLPKNVYLLPYCNSDIRCKHLGWSRETDRQRKYDRYMTLDKEGKYGNLKQYESIMDKNPNLVEFKDEN